MNKQMITLRRVLIAALLAGGLLASAGCDELFPDLGGLFDGWGYDGGWGDDYGWDTGYGDDSGYYNWYTDTAVNGDDTGFYIAGDGFTYTSGW